MSKPDLHRRLSRAHQLTAELRSLQAQVNRTVDQLCELVNEPDLRRALEGAPDEPAAAGPHETVATPGFLRVALATPALRNPPTGQPIGGDARFYTNARGGLIQVVQQPQPPQSDARYTLVFNYAEFEGDLLSVVTDLRELLRGQPAGRARLTLLADVRVAPQQTVYGKFAWRVGKKWTDHTFEVRTHQVALATHEIDKFDPAGIQALDLHLLLNPAPRGSVEIRRVSVTLSVTPQADESDTAAGIFESVD